MSSIFLPENALKCIRLIEENGYSAWAVGGCVRDLLLGKQAHDVDLASSAPPEKIKNIFERVYDTGIAHGTLTVCVDDHLIEVTQYRTDGTYTDHRHPDQVKAVDRIEDDLARRDFTVNAMAWHPERGLIDLFGGQQDLERKLIRCVGDPEKRFEEDALRILRAFRFASKLGFAIEENTKKIALEKATILKKVSTERIQKELLQILSGETPEILSLLLMYGGLHHLGLTYQNADLSVLRRIDSNDVAALLAGLCFLSNVDTQDFCRNLKTSKKISKRACMLNQELGLDLVTDLYECKKRIGFFGEDYVSFLRYRCAVLRENCDDAIAMADQILKQKEPYRVDMLALNGNDLKSLGISNKKIGEVLQILLDRVMRDPDLNTKEKLISMLSVPKKV